MTVDLSTFSLFPATPEQVREARCRTLNEWGKGLTLEEHLARDTYQEAFEGSRDGRLITWVLAPREDPHTLEFKCACETFKRTGLVVDPAKSANAEVVTCYGIASVFTPPEHRGQGFAHHLMRLLHWVLADDSLLLPDEFPSAWGAPPLKVEGTRNGHFSGLWSDVGHFYNACGPVPGTGNGWVVRGTSTTVWDVDDTSTSAQNSGKWTFLDDAGVSELWEEDAEVIRQNLKDNSSGITFSYLPTIGVASFQHNRLTTYLERLEIPPQIWGVVSQDRSTYATWTIDPRPPAPRTLIISRLRAESQTFPGLVGKIFEVTQKYDVKRIEVWNLPAGLETLAGGLGATTHLREEHLPAFKWYGKESEADVSWAFNERFCWC